MRPLPGDEVHVWTADAAGLSPQDVEHHREHLLSREERERYSRYTFEPDRRLFLTARALLRIALSQYAAVAPPAWRFAVDQYGKPRLDPPGEISFSVTHAAGLAAVAVARERPVGVDAESLQRTGHWLPIAERFFAAEEAAHLRSLPPAEQAAAFFQYWTLKEALLKACGRGLSLPLDGFRFELAGGGPPRVHFAPAFPEQRRPWQFFQFAAGDHWLAVAVAGSNHRLVQCGSPPELFG